VKKLFLLIPGQASVAVIGLMLRLANGNLNEKTRLLFDIA
jgi:hypothetical protein